MIDNLEQIKKFLNFESEDEFFFVQIEKRRKENPDLATNAITIQTYHIRSIEQLESLYGEIKVLCDYHNARAMINLNKKSFENTAFRTLQKITNQICSKDFKSVKTAYNSTCSTGSIQGQSLWIVDLDIKDMKLVKELTSMIDTFRPYSDETKLVDVIETPNGYHLITTPFDLSNYNLTAQKWHKKGIFVNHKDIPEIKKNSPTILYVS
jgi:hypothetical protein